GGQRFADEIAARNGETRVVECAELRARVETDVAFVVGDPEQKAIVVPAERARPFRLQAEADTALLRQRAVHRRTLEEFERRHRSAERIEHDLFLTVFLLAEKAREAGAGFEIRVVAVVRRDVALAQVRVAGQRPAARQRMSAAYVQQQQVVLRLVGTRKDRAPVELEQLRRRGAVADQIGFRVAQAYAEASVTEPPAEIHEGLQRLARREIPPSVLLEIGARDEVAEAAVGGAAGLRLHAAPAERSPKKL